MKLGKKRQCICAAMLMGALCLLSGAASSHPPKPRWASHCDRTPAISTSKYPGFRAIYSGNNLIQPAGKADPFTIHPIFVKARVFDSACVPLAGAKIELWQADSSGRYRIATPAALASADSIFTGAGRTTSDNLGRFNFTTLYPAGYSFTVRREDGTSYRLYRAPHFNLRITHDKLRRFNTNIFFEGEPKNAKDHKLRQLSTARRAQVMMRLEPAQFAPSVYGQVASIDIVLPDRQPFRKY